MPLFRSTGILDYSEPYRLVVLVDPELVRYYRTLISDKKCMPQRYAYHITVVRKETPVNLSQWRAYHGHTIDFDYDHNVQQNIVYWWLNCYSPRLTALRVELGLPPSFELTRPPDGTDCFHVTLGNRKAEERGLK